MLALAQLVLNEICWMKIIYTYVYVLCRQQGYKKKQKTLALIIMHIYTCTTRSQTTDVLTSIRVNLEEYSREKS